MAKQSISVVGSNVLILGFTFKENCPDTRNTKVLDLVKSLNDFGIKTYVYDPWITTETRSNMNNINFIDSIDFEFDGLIHAVAHNQFKKIDFNSLKNQGKILYDIKGIIPKDIAYRL